MENVFLNCAEKRVTVKDIAQELNISQGTVSKALSGRSGVSPELKQRIIEAADSMGYKANHLAQAMARNPVRVSIIMPGSWPNYYGGIARGMREQLEHYADYRIDASFHSLPELLSENALKKCIDECIEQKVDGVILSAAFNYYCAKYLNRLEENGISLFLLGSEIPGAARRSCIQIDARKAGMLAGEFAGLILPAGGRAAVFLGNRGMAEHAQKLEGFEQMIRGAGCEMVGAYETQDMPEIAEILTRKVMGDYPDLGLIYAATSNSAAVCRALEQLDPAQRVKVIATDVFDELMPYVDCGRVTASIYQDVRHLGAYAIDECCKLLLQGRDAEESVLVKPQLLLKTNIRDYLNP